MPNLGKLQQTTTGCCLACAGCVYRTWFVSDSVDFGQWATSLLGTADGCRQDKLRLLPLRNP